MRKHFQIALCVASYAASAQGPLPPLNDQQKAEARRLIDGISKDPRGPFGPIQWYCKDGRVLPAAGTPCGKGKGFQHAAPSEAARKLEALDYRVARFLSGMPFEEFLDTRRNHYWLREMLMQHYLIARDSGWIYAKTFARRGVRQAEDEAKEGRRLLGTLLSDHAWVKKNYLLAMLAVSVTPHGQESSRVGRIRTLSAALAEEDRRFQALRGKIHSRPEPDDVEKVEEFVREKRPSNQEGYKTLVQLMREEYQETDVPAGWDFAREADLAMEIRTKLSSPGLRPEQALELADELGRLHELAQRAGLKPTQARTRRQRLEEVRMWIRHLTGFGLLSLRQKDALEAELNRMTSKNAVSATEYESSADYLEGALDWVRAAVSRETGEVVDRYRLIEPHAEGLLDEIVRGSAVLAFANRIEAIARDADSQVGRRHRVLESVSAQGVSALNPGIAIARLEVIESAEEHMAIEPDRMYVIPATAADLKPMRGILTLDSGNALSHAQLLAANLGIPNATVPSSLLPQLRKHRGEEMFFAVTPGGTVVLRPWKSLGAEEQAQWRKATSFRGKIALDTSKTNVADRELMTLEQATGADSGVRSGPKAANLGELKRYFPTRVAPGIVIPFGVYYQHASRKDSSGISVLDRVAASFAAAEKLRTSGSTPEQVRTFMRPKLEEIRKLIREIKLDSKFSAELTRKMREVFGEDGKYGVFVRSDTNAEDLPQFTGAGLNLTVPNVVGTDRILQAIKDVWASPYEERAYEWRAQALVSSAEVYPSVVLLKSVGNDKSGVIATANLATLDLSEMTVNTSEGVAAVVDGGVAESLLVKKNGETKLLAQARAPYRRLLSEKGGFVMLPTTASDYVLSDGEVVQVRQLADDVRAKFPPEKDAQGNIMPWDIEFGFAKGELWLFQIRPLSRYRETKTLEALASIESGMESAKIVRLDEEVAPR
jgi:hypothetical protein